MKVLDFAPPPTSLPDLSQAEGRQLSKLSVQQATGSLPGASVLQAVKDSQREGMAILPALRAGDYKGAGLAFIRSTTAALGAIPEVHALPAFAGIISAYHGSPHVFDEFKLEKVGTGEGAQAYGHGLYFAENEGVAKSYRDSLAEKGSTVGGKPVDTSDPEHIAAMYLHAHGGDRQAALDIIKADAAEAASVPHLYKPGELEAYKNAPAILESGRPLPAVKEGGALYHVDLDVKPEELLDWDKPLSQQAPGVAEKLKEAWLAHPTAQAKQTGAEIYGTLTRTSTPEEASAQLHKAGIPGIKYLDQGSRAEGEGTSNFVIFDPSVIAMVSRNGQPLVSSADKARDGLAVLAHPDAWQPGGAK